MKTYEEMARDVLKRRDEELRKLEQIQQIPQNDTPPEVVYPASSKKRRLLPRIAIPCAAAVTAAAVGLTIWHNVPHRERYVQDVADVIQPSTDENNSILDDGYVFDLFKSEGRYDTDITSVYKGGKTEININQAEYDDVYRIWDKNSPMPNEPHAEDFKSIADDEIDEYYGIEFCRLSAVFPDWKSEHGPFGYYNRDIETSDMVGHSVHGYFTLNTIVYTAENSTVRVSASFDKFGAAVENAQISLINGFDAFIYKLSNGELVADIDMGAKVRISSEMNEDTFIKIINTYTAPVSELNAPPLEEFNILDEMPQFLVEHDPFKSNKFLDPSEGTFKAFTAEEANIFYDIEFDRLGRLHKDWDEQGRDDLGIRYKDYPSTETTDGAAAGGRVVSEQTNTLYYTTPSGSDIYVSANIAAIPKPETEADVYKSSCVNGHYAVIYRGGRNGYDAKVYPNNNATFGALIEFGGTVVKITSAGLSEDEFNAHSRSTYRQKASQMQRDKA